MCSGNRYISKLAVCFSRRFYQGCFWARIQRQWKARWYMYFFFFCFQALPLHSALVLTVVVCGVLLQLPVLEKQGITHVVCVRQDIEANFIKPNFLHLFRWVTPDYQNFLWQNPAALKTNIKTASFFFSFFALQIPCLRHCRQSSREHNPIFPNREFTAARFFFFFFFCRCVCVKSSRFIFWLLIFLADKRIYWWLLSVRR